MGRMGKGGGGGGRGGASERTDGDCQVGKEPECGIRWPTWTFNRSESLLKRVPAWHGHFVPEPKEHQGRQDHIYEVDVKVLLLPNIMDMDIFMAIARIWPFHERMFKKMTMRAIVGCLWYDIICYNRI